MTSSRVEELPDDFDSSLDLNKAPPETTATPAPDAASPSFEWMMQQASSALPPKPHAPPPIDPSQPGAEMPPAMAAAKQYSADEMFAMLNKSPLFMTTLDETGEDGTGENTALEALKALAYEGTRYENASSFRDQGNESARAKQWLDAREFYTKALDALKLPQKRTDDKTPDHDLVGEMDQEAEAKKEKEVEEACYTNRALCQLSLQNYGSCNRDCAAALRINPLNIKAYYRTALANLSLDKLIPSLEACLLGLKVDPENKSIILLVEKIQKRDQELKLIAQKRLERDLKEQKEKATLEHALAARNISTRTTDDPPHLEDASPSLQNPNDASSTLTLPSLLLYPLHNQTDFVKSFAEDQSVGQHLSYIFPLPWDEQNEYLPEKVECYAETKTGGLVKVGKKMALLRILNTGKVELVDGLLRIYVVPVGRADEWIANFKKVKAAMGK